MKVTRRAEKINLNNVVDVPTDVHKDTLYFFFAIAGHEYSDECPNRTDAIEKRLQQYHGIAQEHGMKTLRIICEPTGQYQNKLFRTARRLGYLTCYVNAESVAKFRFVEPLRIQGPSKPIVNGFFGILFFSRKRSTRKILVHEMWNVSFRI